MQHLDEGTIHAWLDGQLPHDEASAVETHVAECRECADAVAEARGLIAASSRILTALDGVPRVKQAAISQQQAAISQQPSAISSDGEAETLVRADTPARQRAKRRWFSAPSLAAAAAIVVAVGTFTVMRNSPKDSALMAPQVAATAERAAGPSADSPQAFGATSASQPVASPAPAGNVPVSANEITTDASVGQRRALADAARREADQVTPRPPAAAEPAPILSRSQVAPDTAAVAMKQSIAGAQANASQVSAQQATEEKARQRAPADPRDEQLSKRRDVAAVPPPKPDTTTVRVFRSAPRELAEARFQADSARPPAAKAADAVSPTGTIRGRVTDGNNTGLASAMVTVDGTGIGVSTTPSGEFDLRGVPAGIHRVVARRVGFAPSSRDITVAAGQAATADFRLSAAVASMENVVVTGAASAPPRAPAGSSVAAAAPPPAQSPTAVGCYNLSITPATTPSRSGFREVPRNIALDSTVVPSRTDGVWYEVRATVRTGGTAGNGVWRPTTPDGVEVQWISGSRTVTLRLTGVPGPVLRGSAEEIDRATAVGEAGVVMASKVRCSS